MRATDELIKSRKIEGLIVQDFKRQVTLQLPKAFSCESIPNSERCGDRNSDRIRLPTCNNAWKGVITSFTFVFTEKLQLFSLSPSAST